MAVRPTFTAGDVFTAANASILATAVVAINAQTGTTYTAAVGDVGKLVTLSNAAAIALTIPPNVFAVGDQHHARHRWIRGCHNQWCKRDSELEWCKVEDEWTVCCGNNSLHSVKRVLGIWQLGGISHAVTCRCNHWWKTDHT
jgi:hypothetical protein